MFKLNKLVFSAASVLLLLSIISCTFMQDARAELSWYDINTGFKFAKQSNKWVLVDVYTDWCGWCKRLDRDTFRNPAVEQYLAASFVCVKANAEDHGAGQALAQKNGVNGFPCVLIFDPSGRLKGRQEGYLGPNEFSRKITSIVAR